MFRDCLDATLRFLKEEDGPTTVEYAVVLSLILGAIIVSVNQLATVVGNSFNASGNAISSAMSN